jgi:hypothetical protein
MKKGIPKKELQEDRNILQHFDISRSDSRDQPVARKPCHTDNSPQNNRQDDPDHGNFQRIQNPDQKGSGIGFGCRERNNRLPDLEPSLAAYKAKTGGDVLSLQIGLGDGEKE